VRHRLFVFVVKRVGAWAVRVVLCLVPRHFLRGSGEAGQRQFCPDSLGRARRYSEPANKSKFCEGFGTSMVILRQRAKEWFTALCHRRANAIARPLRKLVMSSDEVGHYHV
jgi:hypothetical protein